MYYYGNNGGYGTMPYGYQTSPAYNTGYGYGNGYGNGNGYGYGAAIILVLFILLVVIFGAGFLNNGGCCQNKCNSCNN